MFMVVLFDEKVYLFGFNNGLFIWGFFFIRDEVGDGKLSWIIL